MQDVIDIIHRVSVHEHRFLPTLYGKHLEMTVGIKLLWKETL